MIQIKDSLRPTPYPAHLNPDPIPSAYRAPRRHGGRDGVPPETAAPPMTPAPRAEERTP